MTNDRRRATNHVVAWHLCRRKCCNCRGNCYNFLSCRGMEGCFSEQDIYQSHFVHFKLKFSYLLPYSSILNHVSKSFVQRTQHSKIEYIFFTSLPRLLPSWRTALVFRPCVRSLYVINSHRSSINALSYWSTGLRYALGLKHAWYIYHYIEGAPGKTCWRSSSNCEFDNWEH